MSRAAYHRRVDAAEDARYFWAEVDESDGQTLVRARGEVDAGSAPALLEAIESAVAHGDGVAVDLGGVTFMDSSGVRVLAETLRRSAAEGFGFRVSAASEAVARLLEMTGMASLTGDR